MNVIIVDDEPLAIDVLETYIEQMPQLNIVGRCTNALEANELLRNEDVDLMFLDIQMPQITGIDLAQIAEQPANGDLHHRLQQLCIGGIRTQCG